ncbi:NUDIX domain-containing protein [Porticoccaceae bacterium]|nr:NUDIX domain-containing protein [Porticoccaceae bacterium]
MLDSTTFRTVVENTPLVSIDICLVYDNKMLLGKRTNEPLKGQWFTPGGRVLKNESWQDCLRRVAHLELGWNVDHTGGFNLMGVWDHFYQNSAFDAGISTHYVNLPHYCFLKEKPILTADEQHDNLSWFDLEEINNNENFHEYMHSYASWLIKMSNKND